MALSQRRPIALTAERQALADAIVTHDTARAEHEALAAACEWSGSASKAVRAAEAAVEAAQRAMEDIRRDTANRLVDAAASAAAPTIAQARATIDAAADRLEAARAVREILQERLEPARLAADDTKRALSQAAHGVLRVEAGATAVMLGHKASALLTDLVVNSEALQWLVSNGALPTGTKAGSLYGRPVDPTIRRVLSRMDELRVRDRWADLDVIDGAAVWKVAFDGLMTDAATPLPT